MRPKEGDQSMFNGLSLMFRPAAWFGGGLRTPNLTDFVKHSPGP
jgi:hypothetical protein